MSKAYYFSGCEKKKKRNFNPEFYAQQKKNPCMKRKSIYFQMMGKRICQLQTYLKGTIKEGDMEDYKGIKNMISENIAK